jgi:hypothetical protein
MTTSRLFAVVLVSALTGFVSPQAVGQWAATAIVPQPTQKCDDPEPGGDLIKTIEIADQKDGAPHSNGGAGNWYVTRTTKWIPYCMYHDPIGLYSLDTYALTPKIFAEEVQICEALAGGGSRPVAPFAGPCPPPH